MPNKLTNGRHTVPDKTTNCPVCGAEVRVGGNGTTMYYVPSKRTVRKRWAVFVGKKIKHVEMELVHAMTWADRERERPGIDPTPSEIAAHEKSVKVRRVEISWSEE